MIYNFVYPVGRIILTTDSTNPQNIYGGTWVLWGAGRVPVCIDTSQTKFNTIEKTGGEISHTLTVAEMPAHLHDIGSNGYTNPQIFQENIWGTGTVTKFAVGQAMSNTTYKLVALSTGGDQPHNNLQPYITCYMWKRTG